LTAYQTSISAEELAEKLLAVSTPIALSGLTTSLGFLAIGFVDIESIRDVAIFGSFGVLAVLAVTLTGIPAALSLVPLRAIDSGVRRTISKSLAPRLVTFCINRRQVVFLVWAVVATVTLVGVILLRNETDVILWFPEDHEIRADYDFIKDNLSGISPINIVVSAPPDQRVTSPEVIAAIGEFTVYLESLTPVGRAMSISNSLAQIRQVLGVGGGVGLPESEGEIEQSLLLLESSNYMSDLITADRTAANVVLRVNQNGSAALLGIAEKAEAWWRRNGISDYEARATGIMYEFARSQDAISLGQIRGLLFVFVSVGLIVLLVFRWFELAIATLAANVIPIAMGFGAMGLLGVPIDAGTVVVGCIAFGIGVDDTIHTATEFSSGIASGNSNHSAILRAYEKVLPAVVFTTVVTATGFVVLGFSSFALIRNLGIVTSAVMVLCLLSDTLLFPSLLSLLGDGSRGERGNGSADSRTVRNS
jgi:predicted RND superfamily exporter protein